jgi:hypothetical protein
MAESGSAFLGPSSAPRQAAERQAQTMRPMIEAFVRSDASGLSAQQLAQQLQIIERWEQFRLSYRLRAAVHDQAGWDGQA